MARQCWMGRLSIGANNKTFTVDDATYASEELTLATGKYYIDGYSSEGANSVIVALNAATTGSTNYKAIVFSFTYTTRKVRVVRSGGGANFTIAWGQTDLRDLLGFTGDLSGANDYTATNEAKYVWSPDRSFSAHPVEIGALLEPESTTVVHTARDGTLSAVEGTLLYRADLQYRMIAGNRMFIPSTGTVNQEFESFFKDVVHKGEHIRVFPDDTATTSTKFSTVKVVPDGDEDRIGKFGDWARRHIASYNGLWDVRIPVRKVV